MHMLLSVQRIQCNGPDGRLLYLPVWPVVVRLPDNPLRGGESQDYRFVGQVTDMVTNSGKLQAADPMVHAEEMLMAWQFHPGKVLFNPCWPDAVLPQPNASPVDYPP